MEPMSVTGYSDRINHALAFAAKHHAQQVWKGSSRVPYFTGPANVAIILTRYGQDDDTIVAAVLHDVVADCVRDGQTAEMLEQRIGEKFGAGSLAALLAISERKMDDDGVEMSMDERKADTLERLGTADGRARWIVAAYTLHAGSSLLADLRRTAYPETVWGRYPTGRDEVASSYRRTLDRLTAVGFKAPIMEELATVVAALEQLAAEDRSSAPRLTR
ncbi:MAG TPA: HD domain-containing protein [Gemmatimonadaceae bacterium]|nr:HD domain-containing protein [Gemmatimonadaceae bacterium]